MLDIRRIILREIRLPLRAPFRISSGVQHVRRIGLVEMEDASGATAWGECVAQEQPNYSPETLDTAWLAIRTWLAPRLLKRPLESPAVVSSLLERGIRGHLMARAALEMTTWALESERRGIALSKLIGGTRQRVATGISVGIHEHVERLVEKVEAYREEGYRKVKIKIKPGMDVRPVEAIRQACGDDLPLMVDANSAYTLDDRPVLETLDGFGLLMIEQPLGWDDLVQHAALQRALQTPLCLDESITGRHRAEAMLQLGSGRIVNVKPGRVGGFGPAIAIHDLCRQHGVPVWCGGMLESGIGRAHNVALASLPGFVLPGDLSPSHRYWDRDIVTPEWSMDDGYVAVPSTEPGIGVHIDREHIEDLTVRKEVMT